MTRVNRTLRFRVFTASFIVLLLQISSIQLNNKHALKNNLIPNQNIINNNNNGNELLTTLGYVTKLDEKPVLTLIEPYSQCTIHLIGVSHGSEASAMLVDSKIKSIRPSVVILELCDERYFSICLERKMIPNVDNSTLVELYDNKIRIMNKCSYNNDESDVNIDGEADHEKEKKRRNIFHKIFRRINTPTSSSSSSSSPSTPSVLSSSLLFSSTSTQQQASRIFRSMIEYVKFIRVQGLLVGSFISMGMLVSALQRTVRQSNRTIDDEFVTAMKVTDVLNIPLRLGRLVGRFMNG